MKRVAAFFSVVLLITLLPFSACKTSPTPTPPTPTMLEIEELKAALEQTDHRLALVELAQQPHFGSNNPSIIAQQMVGPFSGAAELMPEWYGQVGVDATVLINTLSPALVANELVADQELAIVEMPGADAAAATGFDLVRFYGFAERQSDGGITFKTPHGVTVSTDVWNDIGPLMGGVVPSIVPCTNDAGAPALCSQLYCQNGCVASTYRSIARRKLWHFIDAGPPVDSGPVDAGPPAVLSVSPSSGPVAGGTAVTITVNHGMTGSTAASLDTFACTGFSVINDTQATCTSGAGSAGTGPVHVANATTITDLGAGWTYSSGPPPTLASVLSTSALDFTPYEGGVVLAGTGTNLLSTGSGGTWTLDGVAITVTVTGGGTAWSFTSPTMSTGTVGSGNTHGYFGALKIVTVAGTATDGTTAPYGPFVLPSSTVDAVAAWVGATPLNPANGTGESTWNGILGDVAQAQGNAARYAIYRTAGYASGPSIETTLVGGSGGVPQWLAGTLTSLTASHFTVVVAGQVNTIGADTNPAVFSVENTTSQSAGSIEGFIPTGGGAFSCYVGSTSATAGTPTAGVAQIYSCRGDGTNVTARLTGTDGTPLANANGISTAAIFTLGGVQVSSGALVAHMPGVAEFAFAGIWTKTWATADFTGFGLYAAAKGWATP